jgi:hypothetical protein
VAAVVAAEARRYRARAIAVVAAAVVVAAAISVSGGLRDRVAVVPSLSSR